ncbi:MAG: DUF945 family protein [Desulfobulbaceae bacterium]|nr:DUF945 family protein [Desulfobulbaceae bacterium]
MKKIIAGVVVILIMAGIFAPFVNGLVLEKMISRAENDLNQMYADTGSGVTVEVLNYDRGFSSTKIEWRLKLGNLAAIYGFDEILLVDRAKHGLTGVVSRTSLEKNQWFMDLLNDSLAGKNPLHISTRYTFTGNIVSTIDLDAFSLLAENETVDFRPARIVTEFNEGFNHLLSKATWEGLSMGNKARIDGFSFESDLEKISTYIWEGVIEYSIDNIRIDDREQNLELTKFKGDYFLDFDREQSKLFIGGEVGFADYASGGEKINDAFIRIDVNNLDARGYEEFMELYTGMVQSALDYMGAAREDSGKTEKAVKDHMITAGFQMIAAYEKFLKTGLEIKISDLQAQLPQGKINGRLELKLNRDITFAQLALIATQPGLAFEILSLQSDFSFPAQLAGDDRRLVSPVYPGMQIGLFTVDGENLVHRAQIENGKLFLNGQEVIL